MSDKEIYAALSEIGCCEGCCLRYMGERTLSLYEDLNFAHKKYTENELPKATTSSQFENDIIKKHGEMVSQNDDTVSQNDDIVSKNDDTVSQNDDTVSKNDDTVSQNGADRTEINKNHANSGLENDDADSATNTNGEDKTSDEPPRKRRRWEICPCCLGLLQEETWTETLEKVKEAMESKGYDCKEFACGLSSPASVLLREKCISAYMEARFPGIYGSGRYITSLKEAWKWSFGPKLARTVGKELSSGSYCALIVTLNMEYANDNEELLTLQKMCPEFFTKRQRNCRAYRAEQLYFTRASVSELLQRLSATLLHQHFGVPPPRTSAACRCVSVQCNHTPVYFAGRYIKLSRELSQTPWVVDGRRLMENSIQDVLFAPIAKLYNIPSEDIERRMKLMSAGREDVDVRCLGTGRPFAIELSDPQQTAPSSAILHQLCKQMSKPAILRVDEMCMVDRQDLTHLKHGEETKTKTYRALCVKLTNSNRSDNATTTSATQITKDNDGAEKIEVSDEDIKKICEYSNSNSEDDQCRVLLQQRTPLRVLHRRPLLTRLRKLIDMHAERVAGHRNYFILTVKTEAGTYVKEFVHGDFGRTTPSLRDVLNAHVDILALDVTAVDLHWPRTT